MDVERGVNLVEVARRRRDDEERVLGVGASEVDRVIPSSPACSRSLATAPS
jgi:hypothetical protein